uniref:Uncharacterized protein n=1 Tax=Physcomitrium patens TaxID=3218 RepID=A0A2K1K365_PHYPA|nr:hypothetical protein PHYPA_012689 [Physcomitrium patens]
MPVSTNPIHYTEQPAPTQTNGKISNFRIYEHTDNPTNQLAIRFSKQKHNYLMQREPSHLSFIPMPQCFALSLDIVWATRFASFAPSHATFSLALLFQRSLHTYEQACRFFRTLGDDRQHPTIDKNLLSPSSLSSRAATASPRARRKQRQQPPRRYSRYFCKCDATFSRVNPSTFISCMIVFGTAFLIPNRGLFNVRAFASSLLFTGPPPESVSSKSESASFLAFFADPPPLLLSSPLPPYDELSGLLSYPDPYPCNPFFMNGSPELCSDLPSLGLHTGTQTNGQSGNGMCITCIFKLFERWERVERHGSRSLNLQIKKASMGFSTQPRPFSPTPPHRISPPQIRIPPTVPSSKRYVTNRITSSGPPFHAPPPRRPTSPSKASSSLLLLLLLTLLLRLRLRCVPCLFRI